jgi:phospholipase C
MALRISAAALLALAVGACSSPSEEEVAKTTPVNCEPNDDALAPQRAACDFSAGALSKETLGCAMRGKRLPFEHVILIMQENRSFDHYFQKLSEAGQPDVNVAPDGTTVPAPDGTPVPFQHKTDYCFDDTNHGWNGSHEEWNNGENDGFARANAKTSDPTGARAIGYYDQTDIPFYFQLANTFAISDTYFCSLLGPTWPNRMYFYAGSSFGNTTNTVVSGAPPTLMNTLAAAGVSWKEYFSNLAPTAMFVKDLGDFKEQRVSISELAADVKAGTLPQLAWVDGTFSADGALEQSEHPPADMQVGQKWVYDQVKLILDSPYWENTVIFITYDEHGGLYDHVPPPPACSPDDLGPKNAADAAIGRFDRLGFRVPVFVISPYTKAHYVSHVIHDHTSIVRFVETLFDLPAMTNRDANADAMLDFFDFVNPPFTTPPALDEPPVAQAKLDECIALYPK